MPAPPARRWRRRCVWVGLCCRRVLLDRVKAEQAHSDFGGPRIEQHTFAEFLARGELDRHLRRMRGRYRVRRDALVAAVRQHLPQATVCGIAAGLHAVLRVPGRVDEQVIADAAARDGIAFTVLRAYESLPRERPPTLIIGYARSSEPAIHAGVQDLARVIARLRRSGR